tara:strand:+ start:12967 stop:13551 length:585 start_codon:yes stop_codon:yes gene_type:complete
MRGHLDIPNRTHLSVEGSCGGSSFGLTLAKITLLDGGRVLWVSPEFPNEQRFSQIFAEVDITSSSKFHAVNLVGKLDQTVSSLIRLSNSLPNVKLLVLDDWCEKQGKIASDSIKSIAKLAKGIPDDVKLLLITKLGTNVTGESEFIVRGEKQMKESNFEILCLNKSKNSSDRILSYEEQKSNLVIEDSGFKVKD